jgi:hypothetical protein
MVIRQFEPMAAIPTVVNLATYDAGPEDFMLTPLGRLVEEISRDAACADWSDLAARRHRRSASRMEENSAGGRMVVLVQHAQKRVALTVEPWLGSGVG